MAKIYIEIIRVGLPRYNLSSKRVIDLLLKKQQLNFYCCFILDLLEETPFINLMEMYVCIECCSLTPINLILIRLY